MIKVNPQIRPELDKNYVPAVLWNREYRKLASESGKAVPVVMAFKRPNGTVSVFKTQMLPHTAEYRDINIRRAHHQISALDEGRLRGGYRQCSRACG